MNNIFKTRVRERGFREHKRSQRVFRGKKVILMQGNGVEIRRKTFKRSSPTQTMSTIEETQIQTGQEGQSNDATDYQRDELHTALHERLVQTGEWHRIMASLRASLDESGWSASLREQAQCE